MANMQDPIQAPGRQRRRDIVDRTSRYPGRFSPRRWLLCLVTAGAVFVGGDTWRVSGDDSLSDELRQSGYVIPREKRTVHALAVAVQRGSSKRFGICTPIPVEVGGFAPDDVRVDVEKPDDAAYTKMWLASAYQATTTSSHLLDYHPQALQAKFGVEGFVDGNSAGGIFTVGILSAVRGDALRDDVAMTGAIHPDGTIAGVGGVRYKIGGAKAAGRTTVIIPRSNRFEYDAQSKRSIDLVEYGRQMGVTVKPVVDVWSAYRIYTGKSLQRPEAIRNPQISHLASRHVRDRYPEWMKTYKQGRDRYKSWPRTYHIEYSDKLMAQADQFAKKAEQLFRDGEYASAYWDAVVAAAMSWVAHEIGRYRATYYLKGKRAFLDVPNNDKWLRDKIQKAAAAMRFFRPRTLEQMAVYLEACDAFCEGLAYYEQADFIRRNYPNDEERAIEFAVAAAEQHALAWIDMVLARQLLELADLYEGTPIPEGAPVGKLASFYRLSGVAGLTMFDETVIAELAKAGRVEPDRAAAVFGLYEPPYAVTKRLANTVYQKLPKYFGSGDQLSFAQLAVARSIYTRSSMLLTKHVSLDVQYGDTGEVVRVGPESVVRDLLEVSEEQARRAIGALKRDGVDATTCIQIYHIARTYEGRVPEDRIEALEYYFATNVTAQILRHLAGKTRKPRR